ncbi:hypothetical protein M6B38_404265 [Iris pallida]|uniref:Uncharacterized protein n=1 Tax=Iris pallida TaxID=29817 RepID=A0AAX6FR84_IRIPA|nr:hypothetical protein M6B38_404265 [Iris pallida]
MIKFSFSVGLESNQSVPH